MGHPANFGTGISTRNSTSVVRHWDRPLYRHLEGTCAITIILSQTVQQASICQDVPISSYRSHCLTYTLNLA